MCDFSPALSQVAGKCLELLFLFIYNNLICMQLEEKKVLVNANRVSIGQTLIFISKLIPQGKQHNYACV